MIKRRFHRRPDDARADWGEPVAEHIASGVVLEQRYRRAAVKFGQALTERNEGTVEIGRGGERVRQRGK